MSSLRQLIARRTAPPPGPLGGEYRMAPTSLGGLLILTCWGGSLSTLLLAAAGLVSLHGELLIVLVVGLSLSGIGVARWGTPPQLQRIRSRRAASPVRQPHRGRGLTGSAAPVRALPLLATRTAPDRALAIDLPSALTAAVSDPVRQPLEQQIRALEWLCEHARQEQREAQAILRAEMRERRWAEAHVQQIHQQLQARVVLLEHRTRESTLVRELSELLQACGTMAEASGAFTQIVSSLSLNTTGVLWVYNLQEELEVFAQWGSGPPPGAMRGPESCWALRRGHLHRRGTGVQGLRCQHIAEMYGGSDVCVPLLAQGTALGVLHIHLPHATPLTTDLVPLAFSDELIQTLADHLALALANLRLRETLQRQAIHDPLTGLFNRRYMEASLERELRRAQRHGRPLGVILLDVDHFKQLNDTFGHAAGDTVLRELGTCLRALIRAEDIACRYGGEEFVLVLPDAPLEITAGRATQVCNAVKHLQVVYGGQLLGGVTLSLGVAGFPPHGTTPAALLLAADHALYQAKAGGRDCVVMAPSPV